jgi:hypothetical protein
MLNQQSLANLLAIGLILGVSMVILSATIVYQQNNVELQAIDEEISDSITHETQATEPPINNTKEDDSRYVNLAEFPDHQCNEYCYNEDTLCGSGAYYSTHLASMQDDGSCKCSCYSDVAPSQ